MLIVYFEDQIMGFLEHILFYFLNAWFERYAKLKLTNFDQNVLAGIALQGVVIGPTQFDPIGPFFLVTISYKSSPKFGVF